MNPAIKMQPGLAFNTEGPLEYDDENTLWEALVTHVQYSVVCAGRLQEFHRIARWARLLHTELDNEIIE